MRLFLGEFWHCVLIFSFWGRCPIEADASSFSLLGHLYVVLSRTSIGAVTSCANRLLEWWEQNWFILLKAFLDGGVQKTEVQQLRFSYVNIWFTFSQREEREKLKRFNAECLFRPFSSREVWVVRDYIYVSVASNLLKTVLIRIVLRQTRKWGNTSSNTCKLLFTFIQELEISTRVVV